MGTGSWSLRLPWHVSCQLLCAEHPRRCIAAVIGVACSTAAASAVVLVAVVSTAVVLARKAVGLRFDVLGFLLLVLGVVLGDRLGSMACCRSHFFGRQNASE